jgi:putative salt-induced outer membrane protein
MIHRDVQSLRSAVALSRLAIGASVLALLASGPALAAAPPPPPDGVWTGQGQGGLLISSGNTSATSLNAKLDLAETNGPWSNIVFVGGLYGKNSGITSGERIEGRYELDHKISDRLFWFGSVNGVRDLFSGFNYQATLSTGVGYKFIDSADTKLSGLLGLGYQRLETQTLTRDASGAVVARVNGRAQGSLVGTAGLNLEQKLTGSTTLTEKLFVTSGSLNTAVANDLGIQVSMSDVLALSLGYGIRYNTAPAAGVKKLDQVTTVNVVYKIK